MKISANATLTEAIVFKVVRFKERLSTKIRGVNLAGWFHPEVWSTADFYKVGTEE